MNSETNFNNQEANIDKKNKIIFAHTGLRGVAALTVFITHLMGEQKVTLGVHSSLFAVFDWPNQAVDLFFILSGFILNWVYSDEISGNISWSKYFIARCARILPLYYITLFTFLPPYFATFRIMGWMYEHGKVLAVFICNILLLAGFLRSNHIDWVLNVPSWSISIEFFAYIVIFPLLLHIQYKSPLQAIYLLTFISLLGLMSCYLFQKILLMGYDWTRLFKGVFGFSLGFFVCILFKKYNRPNLMITSGALIVFATVFIFSAIKLIPSIIITIISPIIVYLSAFDKGLLCNILKSKTLQWMGERSYSVYLWHCPIIYVFFLPHKTFLESRFVWSGSFLGWFNVVSLFIVICVVSELSYSFFESPLRNLIRKFCLK